MATQSCHEMATIQLETPARGWPCRFPGGEGLPPSDTKKGAFEPGRGIWGNYELGLGDFAAIKSSRGRSRQLPSHRPPPPRGVLLHGAETLGGIWCKSAQEIPGSTSPSAQRRSSCFPGRRHSRDSGRGSGCFPGRSAAKPGRAPALPGPGPGPRLRTWFGPGLSRATPARPTPAAPVPWRLRTPDLSTWRAVFLGSGSG